VATQERSKLAIGGREKPRICRTGPGYACSEQFRQPVYQSQGCIKHFRPSSFAQKKLPMVQRVMSGDAVIAVRLKKPIHRSPTGVRC
jgi:hypothetical protein